MKHRVGKLLACAALSGLFGTVQAAVITTAGNYVTLTVSDDGTIGDGNATPALVYDPSGTGTFDYNTDYVAPGDPFEGFGFRSNETGLLFNDNSISSGSVGSSEGFNLVSLADVSAGSSFDHHIRYEGVDKGGSLSITHDFFFNDNDQLVNISTVIKALTDLTGVSFSRALDPDPDNIPGGTAATNNDRGLDLNNDGDFTDPGEVAPGDLVTSVGQVSGRPLGLYSNSGIAHQTGIESACCSVLDPLQYLAGGDFSLVLPGFDSTGDNGLGIAFDIGDLANGESVLISYAYVMGATFETIDIPRDVPAPASVVLVLVGLAGLRARRRR